MANQNVNTKKNAYFAVLKVVFGVFGIIGIAIAVLTVTNQMPNILIALHYSGIFGDTQKLILSLSSSILGILFIFLALSGYIDRFFAFLESRGIRKAKDEEDKGVTLESYFFFIIGTLLVVLAVLLGIGNTSSIGLVLKTNLPLLGKYTENVLIGALIVLSILAYITAFNNIIGQALKEMKKVHWPTAKEMSDYNVKVFTFIVFFSVFFFLMDLVFTKLPPLVVELFNKI